MIKEAISSLIESKDLTREEMVGVMNEIMTGNATPAQIGGFLTALRLKGETVEEITGAALVMRQKATRIEVNKDIIVDTCGTGGDRPNTFNISTIAAFVVAGCGLPVAKHGNRAVSSQCGSADLLEGLGVNLDVAKETVQKCIEAIGIGFLFAPLLHGAMKYAIGPRKEMGIRTIFNILGPLTNPAGAQAQVLGVYSDELTRTIAGVLANLGSKHALVVHGQDGLDEITTTSLTRISELKRGKITTYSIKPEDFGILRAKLADIAGGDVAQNVKIAQDVLGGKKGPRRDIVLLNASAAIVAGGKATNLPEGIKLAEDSIDSGEAKKKLELLKKYSRQ
jgi:anthranilate phosphoribosyltransferase